MEPTVCIGESCLPLTAAAQNLTRSSWLAALPQRALRDDRRRNCLLCDEPRVQAAMACSAAHAAELWDTSAAVASVAARPAELLDYVERHCNGSSWCKRRPKAWVPALLPNNSLHVERGWRTYQPKSREPVLLPCSSARGDDAAVLRTFFSDRHTGRPLIERPATRP